MYDRRTDITRRKSGVGMIEYVVLTGLVAGLAFLAVTNLGENNAAKLGGLGGEISGGGGAPAPGGGGSGAPGGGGSATPDPIAPVPGPAFAISVAPALLPIGATGEFFVFDARPLVTLVDPGTVGLEDLVFAIGSGSLPPGLTLDPNTGLVSGEPEEIGDYPFTLEVSFGPVVGQRPLEARVFATLTPVLAISGGHLHSCAVMSDRTARCWGSNVEGQLGTGNTTPSLVPIPVVGIPGEVAYIAGGGRTSCAVTTTADLYCWGRGSNGEIGDGFQTNTVTTPRLVPSLAGNVRRVGVGAVHVCALTFDDELFCWGAGTHGRTGLGDEVMRTAPVRVVLPEPVTGFSLGHAHTCAVTSSAALYCWGNGGDGKLGLGDTTNRLTPQLVALAGVTQVSGGSRHTCAIQGGGTLYCWGHNGNQQLGAPMSNGWSTPQTVGVGTAVTQVVTGDSFTCARAANTICFGRNTNGQLGRGFTSTNERTMVAVSGASNALVLSASGDHACAVLSGSRAVCWGRNADGQIGNNSTTNALVAVEAQF